MAEQKPEADVQAPAPESTAPETVDLDQVVDLVGEAEGEDVEAEEPAAPTPEQRIEALEAELAAANENVLRALADAENTRSRTRRDLEAARKFAVEPLAKELMTALDHLGRARQAVAPEALEADEGLKNLHIGVEMTEKELLKAFEKHHIQQISPLGDPFDPNLHQALQHVEGSDAAPGTVVEVVAPGYMLHDRLMRAAMVLVAK